MNKNQIVITLVIVLFVALAGAAFAYQKGTSQTPVIVAPVATSTVSNTPVPSNPSQPAPKPTPAPAPTPKPQAGLLISSISPSSGPSGTVVTLHGNGFNSTSQVALGNGGFHPSSVNAAGTMITFTMPDSLGAYCRAGQACPMYLMLLKPGVYDLMVKNDNGGISNSVKFTLTGATAAL
ncbi:MAG: hypothetical protein JWM39_238 [Parcubacteria group bacterium]|nr:hypothetical protein [Parcubacteria group bacterium]